MLNFSGVQHRAGKNNRSSQVRHDEVFADKVQQAADALGVDKSTFMRAVIEQEADRVLSQQTQHVLTKEDAVKFMNALDNPPAPSARAKKAARTYHARVVHAD